MDRVVTSGSVWLLDAGGRYCRMPRHEGPRENPEWGGRDAGVIADFIWQPMSGVGVIDRGGKPCLRLMPVDGEDRENGISTGPIVDGLDVARRYSDEMPIPQRGYYPQWTWGES